MYDGCVFKGKKILLVGLGILGGGVATARFLIKHGASLKITDMRDKKTLIHSIKKLPKTIHYTLGKHLKKDFNDADIIVANPAVPRFGEWIIYAEKKGKKILNDLTLFLSVLPKGKKYIAVTGTRGKTTTTLWINHFIKKSIIGGNIPEAGPLAVIYKKGNPFVLETSSFQLEYITRGIPAPSVALITNIYQDHLNRHKTMEAYIEAKAKIFLNQTEEDHLVLNFDNIHTKNFLTLKPKSKLFFFSCRPLPRGINGLFVSKGVIYHASHGKHTRLFKSPFLTSFENQNFLGALLVSYLYTKLWPSLKEINTLPNAPMRREVIIKRKGLMVINDSAGTSPDATIALLEVYTKVSKRQKVLISGGTNKQLDFSLWAKKISQSILPENLFLLEGSATAEMIKELHFYNFWKTNESPRVFKNLKDLLFCVSEMKNISVVLFSPSSASFEKFRNEFDRGNTFSRIARKVF